MRFWSGLILLIVHTSAFRRRQEKIDSQNSAPRTQNGGSYPARGFYPTYYGRYYNYAAHRRYVPPPTAAPTKGPTLQPTAAPTQSGTIYNTVWGGSMHTQHYYNEFLWLSRPQWSKFERCTQDYCEECDGQQACWYGNSAWDSKIVTTSSDSGHFVNYTMVVHPACPTGTDALLKLQISPPIGGLLKLYYDEELVRTISATDYYDWEKQLDGSSGKELRCTWIPQQSDSAVDLTMQVYGVTDTFAQCQDQEVCLKVLGDQAGLRLREENHLLKQCLDHETSSFDTAIAAKCVEWLTCLEQSGLRDNMAHTLNAARVQPLSTSQQHGVVENTPACINPYIADVFSWECDCYAVAQHKCQTENEYAHLDLDTCLHTMLCHSDKICDSWKVDSGCATGSSLVEGVAGSENAAQALLEHGSETAVQQLLLDKHAQLHLQDRSLEDSLGAKACV